MRQIIPIISLGQRAALSALLLRANCQPDTLPIPPIRENLGVLLRTCVRSRWLSMYAHTQRKTENAPYRGIKSRPCPPAIGGEVGLHKGFDAHKALDTPPGRIDDVVGGFQITSLYSVTEESTFSRSPCMAFLPPSGGVFRLSHFGVMAGYPMQTVMRFSRYGAEFGNKKSPHNNLNLTIPSGMALVRVCYVAIRKLKTCSGSFGSRAGTLSKYVILNC